MDIIRRKGHNTSREREEEERESKIGEKVEDDDVHLV